MENAHARAGVTGTRSRGARVRRWVAEHRGSLLAFVLAFAWFLPGLWWGLPVNSGGVRMSAWGVDELGPWGGIDALLALVRYPRNDITPQYPLAHFLVQAVFVWPYYAPYYVATMFPSVTDRIGFPQGQVSMGILMLLHRLPSLLMAAGIVAIAHNVGKRIAGNAAAWTAAAAVATIGPLAYYARTSNVDVPALFWTVLALPFALRALREGLTVRLATVLGLCAGIATATKDQQYAFFVGMGLVLLTTHLLDRRRSGQWQGWWRGPLAGFVAGGAIYLVLSGILVLPDHFARHLRFTLQTLDPRIPQDQLTLSDGYWANPATLEGYLRLASHGATMVYEALGLPVIVLALAGIVVAARTNPRLLALLLVPILGLVFGVFLQVRFIAPRFLLPVDVVLCLFAALAVGMADRLASSRRFAVRAVAVASIGWAAVHSADITMQMLNDSRYEAARWLERNVQPGDVVAHYGSAFKLPRLPADVIVKPAGGQFRIKFQTTTPELPAPPAFLISIPQLRTEPVHEISVTDDAFMRLFDPASGYQQVYAGQTAALWPRPLQTATFVNPPVRIFARNDVVARLREPPRIALPDPR